MNGARAQAFEALGRISAELSDGPLDEHRGRVLAEQIRRAVEEIARPVAALRAQPAPSDAEIARLQAIIERDRSDVARGTSAMREVFRRHAWLADGRGSYEWDDDRWHDEFKVVRDSIIGAMEKLDKIASDWTDCPKTQDEVNAARAIPRQPAPAMEPRPLYVAGICNPLKRAYEALAIARREDTGVVILASEVAALLDHYDEMENALLLRAPGGAEGTRLDRLAEWCERMAGRLERNAPSPEYDPSVAEHVYKPGEADRVLHASYFRECAAALRAHSSEAR